MVQRGDDFEHRRAPLAALTDEELRRRFWDTAGRVVEPLVNLARTHTTPSIERSVLLRMGFSSLESNSIVATCAEKGLLGKGAGHVVWRLSRIRGCPVREAGQDLAAGKGWDEVAAHFGAGKAAVQ